MVTATDARVPMIEMTGADDLSRSLHVSELWREYERFAHSDDPFDRTTAQMLFNAATDMDSAKRAKTHR